MPQMVLKRNYVLTSTQGHSIGFQKDVPVGVPPKLVPKALEIGAEFVKVEQKEGFLPEEKVVASEVFGDERETAILESIRRLVEENDPDHFTAGGKPKFKALSVMAGFKVDAQESQDLWAKYQEMQFQLKQGAA